jgi:hypothetical protein
MRPEKQKAFDPHKLIDVDDEKQLRQVGAMLDASPEEISEAVEKVGPQPVAVAIFLGRGDVV